MKLDKKQIFTIPNLLSTFRIVLAFVFLAAFYQSGASGRSNLLTAIILLSALTDFLDGKIAGNSTWSASSARSWILLQTRSPKVF